MLRLTSTLGLLCLFYRLSSVSAAPTTLISERSFNPRQKWQRDEVNCIQIFNPSPGASFHPGYFVRMSFGDELCEGAEAVGPWTIHLYNNPDINGDKLRFDYHEILADNVDGSKNQYLWNITPDQEAKVKNVKKIGDYYVRVETSSYEGVKLVGNAGPFTIYPDHLQRRADPATAGEISADFALRPKGSPDDTQAPSQPAASTPSTSATVPLDGNTRLNVTGSKIQLDKPPSPSDFPKPSPPPTPIDLGLTDDNSPKPPVTEISKGTIFPSKYIVVGAVAGGAAGLGVVGGSFFGQVGTIVGSILGGVVGGLAVVLSYVGVPV
ncbi:hypothetical protein BGZ99_003646 [Dissophora globulifera]|uniref:Uncharacterized protein n=1 Tax=Dissophora globulifera TaxID=979702 RepID=A0A9P6RV00_9FUNG|nr:hypothetical protein BGZ99_003646 [Dissophora globulifera]